MKKFIRLASVIFAFLTILSCFVGCSNSETETNSNSKASSKSETKDLKIEDIAWSVDGGIIDGERYVMLSYTNNSKFTISDIEISFSEKDNLTEEQKTKYFDDLKKIVQLDESDPDDVSNFEELKSNKIFMSVESNQICQPGESISNKKCRYYDGFLYAKNVDHYNLVEPDIATIKYVDNNAIFTINYDFKSQKLTKDTKTETAFYWTEKEIGNSLPKPNADIVSCDGIDYEDRFSFKIHGWSLDDFNSYIKQCQENGFTIDKSEYKGFYSADTENGYSIFMSYDEEDCIVSAKISKDTSS